jgi:hypothetical protein
MCVFQKQLPDNSPKTLNADWCYKNENDSLILKICYRVLLLLHKGTLAIRKNIPPENGKKKSSYDSYFLKYHDN